MKLNKQILEAVNKGIKLALDDFDYNSYSSNMADIIDAEDDIIKYRYKTLLSKFEEFITQNIYDKEQPLALSINELNEFINISLEFNIKYKFAKRNDLIAAIRNISHFIPDANLNFFDVSEIDNMSWVFHHSNFIGDISEWDVSNVENMNYMFCESHFNGDISKWNVSKVITMIRMFELNTEFNQDISEWDVSSVTDMLNMFAGATSFNQDISKWNLKNIDSEVCVTNMFGGCPIKREYKPKFKCSWKSEYQLVESSRNLKLAIDDYQDMESNSSISRYNDIIDVEDVIECKIIIHKFIPSIIRMADKAFYECITYEDYFKFVDAVNKLNRKIKLGMPGTFGDYQFKKIVQHIIFGLFDKYPHINLNWIDTSSVKSMSYLLANFPGTLDVSEWNVSNVEIMDGLFAGSNFNGNLSKWNVSNVKNMNSMFSNSKFNNDSIKNWNVSNVDNMQLMFMESKFNQNINNWHWYIRKNCKVTAMFSRSKMESKNIPNWLKKMIINQTVNGLK